MNNEPLNDVILQQFHFFSRRTKLPGSIRFLRGEGDTAVMVLSRQDMEANMQSNEAAFEACALLIHVHCGFRVELAAENAPEDLAYRRHYGRFLYRAMKFSDQYSGWFSLSPALKDRVENFRAYLRTNSFCNNVATGPAGPGNKRESRMEALMVREWDRLLRPIAEQAGIVLTDVPGRQFPVGLFEGDDPEKAHVFTGGKSAIDLWATSGDNIVIFELKVRNVMVGILSELMFYANYMADMYINDSTFTHREPLTAQRGYEQLLSCQFHRVQAAMLTDRLHPLITPAVLAAMNLGPSNIRYYDLRYTLDETGCPAAGERQ